MGTTNSFEIKKMSLSSILKGNTQSKEVKEERTKLVFGRLIAEGKDMVENNTSEVPKEINSYSYSKNSDGSFNVTLKKGELK